ncbi:MAG: peptide ABC transporter substrate-binding protein, partial [Alphaproteobacteria bacterium]|nr:peptide ABC transporter substrate-binding protein [Alphaproteobacteria bacterium]
GRHTTTGLMCDHAPFKDNVDLRLALKYAIDREGILRNVRRGYGTIANDHPLSPFDPYYCRDLPQRTYDPDRAKFHLKNTGLSSFDVVLTTSDAVGSEGPDLAVHFRQTAAPCGINIQVKKEPVDGYWSNVWMNRPRSMGTYLPRATADQVLSLAHSSGAKWNGARFENPRIDQLPAEGRRTLDQAKRRQVHCDLQRIINEDGGSIIPMFLDCLDARAAKLGGYEPHPVGEAGGCRMTEKIWMQA